jgi:hypothetical protein
MRRDPGRPFLSMIEAVSDSVLAQNFPSWAVDGGTNDWWDRSLLLLFFGARCRRGVCGLDSLTAGAGAPSLFLSCLAGRCTLGAAAQGGRDMVGVAKAFRHFVETQFPGSRLISHKFGRLLRHARIFLSASVHFAVFRSSPSKWR